MNSAKDVIRHTEFAIHSFKVHPRSFDATATVTSGVDAGSQTVGASSRSAQAHEFYSSVPRRPSQYFIRTVGEFEKYLAKCWQWIEESEHLLHVDKTSVFPSSGTSLDCLPSVLSNIHDYFIHVAAKVENLHQCMESMKTAYLAEQRRRGNANDPFLEAERRETAELEAAARRVHPTLHFPAIPSLPASHGAGPCTSPAVSGASIAMHQCLGSSGGFTESAFSMFSTPLSTPVSVPTSSSFLFSTPSSSAPTSTLFIPPDLSPQYVLSELIHTSPMIGTSSPPTFTLTPTSGSSSPFFTPSFASGAALSSRGAKYKASKRKSHAPRHK